jgi:membrane protease subunit (stomatin/prohibitin family)
LNLNTYYFSKLQKMAIIDVVKIESNNEDFVVKFPSEDLRLGTQVIVNTSQTAFFVKGGKIFDQFESGTFTLKTENIPLLNKLINLPFGSNSPFQAEVWYVNLISKLDLKWGTPNPIQLEDPKYKVIVPVRAFGQYGFRISNPRVFLETLVGNMSVFSASKINEYFKGKILSSLTSLITVEMISKNVSILEINAHLDQLSIVATEKIGNEFEKYGIEIVNFFFSSINVPENDESIIKLKEAKDLAAKLQILGRDNYQMERSFGVLDRAAENDGGLAGTFAGAGLGLGVGAGIAGQMNQVSGNLTTNIPPPIPSSGIYHVIINGLQSGPYEIDQLIQFIQTGQINYDSFLWKPGMSNWVQLKNIPELISLISNVPPPPPVF